MIWFSDWKTVVLAGLSILLGIFLVRKHRLSTILEQAGKTKRWYGELYFAGGMLFYSNSKHLRKRYCHCRSTHNHASRWSRSALTHNLEQSSLSEENIWRFNSIFPHNEQYYSFLTGIIALWDSCSLSSYYNNRTDSTWWSR